MQFWSLRFGVYVYLVLNRKLIGPLCAYEDVYCMLIVFLLLGKSIKNELKEMSIPLALKRS